MKYYILGHLDGAVALLTRRVFDTFGEASDYAASVHPALCPFVVQGEPT